ncbi:MAG TPA: hypothetical protein VHX44_15185 [Planctomycetota bacterium]|jgi:hypothetical protein|nr:hypothetical protein [Planctomycetota bacterium]
MSSSALLHSVTLGLLLITQAVAAEKKPAPPAAPTDPLEIVSLRKAKMFLYEDFEGTDVGKIPKGYEKKGSCGVVEGEAHTGIHSLRLDAAVSGARQIVKRGAELAAMGGEHWGRLYFKVQLPSPLPAGGGMHTTIVVGSCISPLPSKDPIEVRLMGTSTGGDGAFHFLYNVQPMKGRPEFGPGGKTSYHYSDKWTLAEWYADYATQTYRFFIDGKELPELALTKGAGNYAGVEIPEVFDTMAFGWCNYQAAAGTGFVTWIDDIALSKERIGDQTLLPVGGPPEKKKH